MAATESATSSDTPIPSSLHENWNIFNDEEKTAAKILIDAKQSHIFEDWPSPGTEDAEKKSLLHQTQKLNSEYPDGLVGYRNLGARLLYDARVGVNPYEGWTPSVPSGERLEFDSPEFRELEQIGLEQLGYCGFAIGAGGQGERLGYPDIKPAIASEITTMTTFMEWQIRFILEFQARAREKQNRPDLLLPLAFMVSGDTADRTKEFMKTNDNFGMVDEQIVFLHQNKVACFADNSANFAMSSKYEIATKSHGHGDIHSLLFLTGTATKWLDQGLKWWIFFQDTNMVAFRSLISAMVVSCRHNFLMNTITVPRRPGQQVGGMTELTCTETGEKMTINVEYNQLGPMLQESNGKGDVADETGNSPFPGNTNTLIFKLDEYADVLQASRGIVAEFVNPKYADEKRTIFQKPTRLECMVQEFPKLYSQVLHQQQNRSSSPTVTTVNSPSVDLTSGDKRPIHAIECVENVVAKRRKIELEDEKECQESRFGITQLPRWLALEPVKNNIKSAKLKFEATGFADSGSSGEASIYFCHRQYLRAAGVDVQEAKPREFDGISVKYGARVILCPSFGSTLDEIDRRCKGKISVSERSTLIIEGDVEIGDLELDGALHIRAAPGGKIVIESLKVENDGWEFEPVDVEDPDLDPVFQMRGYKLKKEKIQVIESFEGECLVESGC